MYPPSRYTAPWDRLVTRITPNTKVKPLDTRKMIPASVSPFRVWAMNCCTLGGSPQRRRPPGPGTCSPALPCRNPACSTNQARGRSQYVAGAGYTPLIIISVTTGGAARQRNGRGRRPGDSQAARPWPGRLAGRGPHPRHPGRSARPGLLLPGPLVAQRRQQALKQPDLGAVEPDGGRVGRRALLGLGQALLRRSQLLTQLGVLLGQPPLLGPDAGQLLLQAGHGPGERDIVRALAGRGVLRWLRALHRQRADPLHDLQQQPPRQLVVVELLGAFRPPIRPGH